MRGTVAKKLRKIAQGDKVFYKWLKGVYRKAKKEGKKGLPY